MLLWGAEGESFEDESSFHLQVNGVPLIELDFLNLDFSLVEEEILMDRECAEDNSSGDLPISDT